MTDCADLHDQILLFLQVAEAPPPEPVEVG
jgi:hypothetical protein